MTENRKAEKVENPPSAYSGGGEKEDALIYELGYHLLPTLAEDEISKEVDTFKNLIKKNNGSFISEEAPKLTHLAYTMVKKQEGKNVKFTTSFFGWMKFETTPMSIIELKDEIYINKNVLRFLIIKTVREYTPLQYKQIFKQPKEEIKPISKPEMVEKKKIGKPISDEELDKTIEELVA